MEGKCVTSGKGSAKLMSLSPVRSPRPTRHNRLNPRAVIDVGTRHQEADAKIKGILIERSQRVPY